MNINEIIYGDNNQEYLIEKIDKDSITVKYIREISILYNANSNQKKEIKIEILNFYFNQIGINIFFKKDDCKKNAYELLQDKDYKEYKDNIYNRLKKEELKKEKELKSIKDNAPEIQMTKEQKNLKLLNYENKEFSQSEEEKFYNKAKEPYFARMDLDTEYHEENYYERYYISKKTIKKKIQRGIFENGIYITPEELKRQGRENLIQNVEESEGINKTYEDGIKVIHWSRPIASLYYDKENNILQINDYKYEVMLKRNFLFNPLRYVNTYIENNPLYKEGSVDQFLLENLIEKRNSDNLTDIIYSIQSNQNKIIRADKNENFIVQGCAGSGKTMILLHRLSYLKFNKKLPEYHKIKIITPNKIFSNYINDLSHDLDISEIAQITISNYYNILNNLYIKRYNRIKYNENELKEVKEIKEKINKLIDNKNNKYKRIFEKNKMVDESELSSQTIIKLYSKDIFNFIKYEYDKKIKEAMKIIKQLGICSEGNVSNNYQYIERSIYRLIVDIEKIEKNKIKLKDNLKNKKEKLEILQKKLKGKKYEDFKTNEEKCEKLKEELKTKNNKYTKLIEKNKTLFNKIKKLITSDKEEYLLKNDIIILEGKIENIEKEISNVQIYYKSIKDEITSIEVEINEIQEIINERERKEDAIKNKIKELVNNIYFTIDFYEYIIEKLKDKNILPIENGKFVRCQLLMYLYINYLHFGELINNDNLLCFDEAQDYNILEYKILRDINKNVIFNLYGDVNQSLYAKGIFDWKELIEELKLKKYYLNENYRNTLQITKFCNKQFGFHFVSIGLNGRNVEYIKPKDIKDIIYRKINEKRKIAIIYKAKNDFYNIENEYVTYSTVSMVKGIEYDTVIVEDKNMSKNEKYVSYTRALNELYIIQ